jgi:pyruvate,orthophosphate dikinase
LIRRCTNSCPTPRNRRWISRGKLNIPVEKIINRVHELHEFNPMLGFRGCRLGIKFPEITRMQARAVFEAAADARRPASSPSPKS